VTQLRAIIPGLAVAALLAAASQWTAGWLGTSVLGLEKSPVSAIMLAILVGLAIGNLWDLPTAIRSGLRFAQTHVLRLGIVLLGLRLSLTEAGSIGLRSLPVILCTIAIALLAVSYLGRRMGLPVKLGVLIGVGTSICGATAIVATAPTIGARDEEVSYAVGCIAIFGMLAMMLYPFAAHFLFQGDAVRSGMFLGTAVHDTAQVIGAGMAYQQYYGAAHTLEVATVTKMVRNLAMIAVIPAMAIMHRTAGQPGTSAPRWYSLIPLFVVGFAAMSLLRTLGDSSAAASDGGSSLVFGFLSVETWALAIQACGRFAEVLLATAMGAVGLSTNVEALRSIGVRPLLVALACAVLVGVVSAGLISVLD
jgi:uncharacterized integral membrane protein (TIGR00698 family)